MPKAQTQARKHAFKLDPKKRPNHHKSWCFGVLSGGILIDMMETLSDTKCPEDWALVCWMMDHYIFPFGRVERLDGLVGQSAEDIHLLIYSRLRYDEIIGGEMIRRQSLWVPGLEPRQNYLQPTKSFQLPTLPRGYQPVPWYAEEMFSKHGVQRKRKGLLISDWTDGWGWQRKLWTLQEKQVDVGPSLAANRLSLLSKIVVTETSLPPEKIEGVEEETGETVWEGNFGGKGKQRAV